MCQSKKKKTFESSKKRPSSKNKSNKKVVENKKEITERVIVIDLWLVNLYTAIEYDSTLASCFILRLLIYYNESEMDKAWKQITHWNKLLESIFKHL